MEVREFLANDVADVTEVARCADSDSAKMASDQSKWLATAAGTLIVLAGAILKSDINENRLRESCAISAGLAVLFALISMMLGSVVQGAILQFMTGGKKENSILPCRDQFRWYHLSGTTIGEHLWQQRLALYSAVIAVSIGFSVEITQYWEAVPNAPVSKSSSASLDNH